MDTGVKYSIERERERDFLLSGLIMLVLIVVFFFFFFNLLNFYFSFVAFSSGRLVPIAVCFPKGLSMRILQMRV